jgi:hypothetical protein
MIQSNRAHDFISSNSVVFTNRVILRKQESLHSAGCPIVEGARPPTLLKELLDPRYLLTQS